MLDGDKAWLLVLLSVAVLGLGGYLLRTAVRGLRVSRAFAEAAAVTCAEAAGRAATSPGTVCVVSGTTEPGPRGMLDAPISGRPCVWYHMNVTRAWGTWRGDRYHRAERVLFDEGASWEFTIRDATGEIMVDPDARAVERVMMSARRRSAAAEPRFRLPKAPAGQGYEYSERLIPRGRTLHVLGEVAAHPRTGEPVLRRPRGGPFVISPLDGRRRGNRARYLAVAGMALMAAALAGLIVNVPALAG